jgi:hypothetical protein
MSDTQSISTQLAAFRLANQVTIDMPALNGEATLPLTLRKIGLEDLVISGMVPDTLSGLVDQVMNSADDDFKVGFEELDLLGDMFGVVLMACVVSPPIAEVGSETHLGMDEIPFEVKNAIFEWANGDAAALDPFRAKPDGHGEPSPAGENVRKTAE